MYDCPGEFDNEFFLRCKCIPVLLLEFQVLLEIQISANSWDKKNVVSPTGICEWMWF